MFTGLVERKGRIRAMKKVAGEIVVFEIAVGSGYNANIGDSIAVEGCCLTVTRQAGNCYFFDLSAETMRVTSLGDLREGDEVNLERSLRVGDRMGGHFVTGHIDGVGAIDTFDRYEDGTVTMCVALSPKEAAFVAAKGSICIKGVSLTVNAVDRSEKKVVVSMTLIPHTLGVTTLGSLSVGARVNYETDVLAKHVVAAVGQRAF